MIIQLVNERGERFIQPLDMLISSQLMITVPVTDANGTREQPPGPFIRGSIFYLSSWSAILGVPYNFIVYNIHVKYVSNLSQTIVRQQTTKLCGDNRIPREYDQLYTVPGYWSSR